MKDKIYRFLHWYQNIPVQVKATLWFTVCSFLQKGISLITVPIFTRLMTASQYGVFSVYQSWYQIISIFATLNLSLGVFNNGMIDFESDRKRYVSAMQGLSTTVTIVVFCVYMLFQTFWDKLFGLNHLYMYMLFLELLFVPAFSLWCAYKRFRFQYIGMVVVTLVMSVLAPLLGVIAVISTEYKAEARIISFVLVQVIFGIIFYIINVKRGKSIFSSKYWKYALCFNIPLIPHYLSSIILTNSDRLMINSMVGSDKAAIYSVVYNVSAIMNLLINAISNSFTPYAYQNIKAGTMQNIKKTSKRLIFVVASFSVLIMFLGPEVISFFAPEEYSEAVWIIPPVIAASYFFFLYPMFNIIEFYYKKNIYVTIASCIGAVLNIVLNYLLIPIFGYIVAGYTTLVCYILFAIGHYCVMSIILRDKGYQRTDIYDSKYILKISIGVLLLAGLSLVLYRYTVMRVGILIGVLCLLIFQRKKVGDIIKTIKR